MNTTILGAAGFIGTNLTLELAKDANNIITVVDEKESYFSENINLKNVNKRCLDFNMNTDFNCVLKDQHIVYHLISTNNPSTSNRNIGVDIAGNIDITINLLEACVRQNVKKIIFLSSGGAVYGNAEKYPIKEETVTNPITSYGIQKLAIEKLIYLYHYIHGLDYAIVRLANPYGPYQRPNGKLGVVTTFIHKALHEGSVTIYGDGKVIRDYIYISDAIKGIIQIANSNCEEHVFNLGSGKGMSIDEVVKGIENALHVTLEKRYMDKRSVDVPVNFLDMSKYESFFEKINLHSFAEGVLLTADFMRRNKM